MYLYRNTKSETSKCNWVMDRLAQGWPNAQPAPSREYLNEPAAFWGFIENNWHIIKQHQETGVDWWFWDMPYLGRFSSLNPSKEFYWRVSKNGIHATDIISRPSDRFNKWEVDIKPWRRSGEFILVCASSDTMTRWCTGKDVHSWTMSTVEELKKYTDRPIHVRYKPRAAGTSGPDASALRGDKAFKFVLDNVWAVVTTVSMCAIEAQLEGIPTFCDPQSAAAPVSETDLSKIDTPRYPDREPWLYHLAYQQFTQDEIADGTAYRTLTQ